MGKKIQGSILNHLSDTKLRNCATTIKQKTTILAPFSDGASPGILVQLLCFSFFVKQSHQVPRCHVSGPTQFTVVAGMGKKLLGLTNKDAHVSFFFFFFKSTLCYKPSELFHVCPFLLCKYGGERYRNLRTFLCSCSFSSYSLVLLLLLPIFFLIFRLAFFSFSFSFSILLLCYFSSCYPPFPSYSSIITPFVKQKSTTTG